MKVFDKSLPQREDIPNLPFETSPYEYVMMSIDSAGFFEDALTLLTFVAILLIATFSGFFGPKPYTTEIVSNSFAGFTNIYQPRYAYNIHNISSMTRSIHVEVVMERKPGIEPEASGFSIQIESVPIFFRDYNKIYSPIPIEFVKDSPFSVPLTVFQDDFVQYISLFFQISFTPVTHEYYSMRLLFHIGNNEHSLYIMVFRILFTLSTFLMLILLYNRLKNIKLWHMEQRITILLLITLVFYLNPLYGFKLLSWTKIYIIDSVLKGAMAACVSYFLMVLFDNLRYKNLEMHLFFFFPKVMFSLCLGVMISVMSLDDIFHIEKLVKFKFLTKPTVTAALLYLINIIRLAYQQIDSTEKYKFYLYLFLVSISFLTAVVAYYVKEGNTLTFTIQYVYIAIFAVVMGYFHWPYHAENEQIKLSTNYSEDKASPSESDH